MPVQIFLEGGGGGLKRCIMGFVQVVNYTIIMSRTLKVTRNMSYMTAVHYF